MVARRPKVIAAGVVLAVGLGLAWPLRRTPAPARQTSTPQNVLGDFNRPASLDPTAPLEAFSVAQTVANAVGARPRDPFAITPAASKSLTPTDPLTRPAATTKVFSTIADASGDLPPDAAVSASVEPAERTHVVHEGDSLQRLAQRYLGDEGRALEIFDLNRHVLDNPHLLKIGIELRIPPDRDARGSR